jgi:hypothetical protein
MKNRVGIAFFGLALTAGCGKREPRATAESAEPSRASSSASSSPSSSGRGHSLDFLFGSNKVTECNQIIRVINPVVERIKDATQASAAEDGTKMFIEVAVIEEAAAADLAALHLTTPEVEKYSRDYQAMSREISTASRNLAAALKSDDDTKRSDALKRFTDANEKEGPIVDGLNKFCTGGT